MAQARRRHLDQDFAAAGRVKIELSDFERLRMGVGRLEAGLAKNGGLNAHGGSSCLKVAGCWARPCRAGSLTRPAPSSDDRNNLAGVGPVIR